MSKKLILQFQENNLLNNFLYVTHTYGQCVYSEELKLLYIPIPKVGSQPTSKFLLSNGWKIGNFNDKNLKNYLFFCPLRDPIDRWLSGVREFSFRNLNMEKYHDTTSIEDLVKIIIFTKSLDEHTFKQVLFLPNFTDVQFIRFDSNYNYNLLTYLSSKGMNKIIIDSAIDFFKKPNKKDNILSSTLENIIQEDSDAGKLLISKFTDEYEFHNRSDFIF